MNEERKRILEMLAGGQISAQEAAELLEALEGGAEAVETQPQRPARLLRININDADGTQVRVNLPLALARFALKFVPKEQQEQIAASGFDLDELLSTLGNDMPEGKLVEIKDADGAEVLIEVV
ncbi:SHOCT-like domain-containing protein [Oceanithermus sp.]